MKWLIDVYRVEMPDGMQDYVSCLPHDHAFSHGLTREGIIGVLARPLAPGEAITPALFARNPAFVDFMHDVISRRAPLLQGFIAEARRQGSGFVYIIDQRTPTPQDAVPPEDIVGAFEVKGGQVVQGSYRANPQHMILTSSGFFQLGPELQTCLLEELMARA